MNKKPSSDLRLHIHSPVIRLHLCQTAQKFEFILLTTMTVQPMIDIVVMSETMPREDENKKTPKQTIKHLGIYSR